MNPCDKASKVYLMQRKVKNPKNRGYCIKTRPETGKEYRAYIPIGRKQPVVIVAKKGELDAIGSRFRVNHGAYSFDRRSTSLSSAKDSKAVLLKKLYACEKKLALKVSVPRQKTKSLSAVKQSAVKQSAEKPLYKKKKQKSLSAVKHSADDGWDDFEVDDDAELEYLQHGETIGLLPKTSSEKKAAVDHLRRQLDYDRKEYIRNIEQNPKIKKTPAMKKQMDAALKIRKMNDERDIEQYKKKLNTKMLYQ